MDNQKENQEESQKPHKFIKGTNRKFKHYAILAEALNYNSIIVIPCDGDKGWYQILDNSALFFYYEICKGETKSKFKPDDTDFGIDRSRIGIINAKGIATIRQKIENAKLLKSESFIDYRGLPTTSPVHGVVFHLKKTFNQAKVDKLYKTELERRENNLHVEHSKHLDPVLYRESVMLAERIHRICRKSFDNCSKETIGRKLNEDSELLVENYLRLGYILGHYEDRPDRRNSEQIAEFCLNQRTEKLTKMQKNISNIIINLDVAHLIGNLNIEKCVTIGSRAEHILKMINTSLALVRKEQAELVKNSTDEQNVDENQTNTETQQC